MIFNEFLLYLFTLLTLSATSEGNKIQPQNAPRIAENAPPIAPKPILEISLRKITIFLGSTKIQLSFESKLTLDHH